MKGLIFMVITLPSMGIQSSKLAISSIVVICTSLFMASSSMSQPGSRSQSPEMSGSAAPILPEIVAPVSPFVAQSSGALSDSAVLNHLEALHDYARQITVRVIVGEQWGTGTLIQRWGSYYRIVTNRHVVTPGQTYQVEMPDGQIYPAALVESASFPDRDLALLQVQANADYSVIQYFADSSTLLPGSPVVASGFPFDSSRPSATGLRFTVGLISLISDRELEDGYQIGYTNDIVKGMSGGPVLDWNGLLIAINGIHAYPLWGSSYRYITGESVNASLAEKMTHYSWSIPINTFTALVWPILHQDPASFSNPLNAQPSIQSTSQPTLP